MLGWTAKKVNRRTACSHDALLQSAHSERIKPLGKWVYWLPVDNHQEFDRFVQAVNQEDTKTFLAFFPKDGVVIDSGRRFVGRDGIRGWSDREFIGAYGHMTVKAAEQKKNAVTVKADWSFLAANVTLRIHPAISGTLVGLLISLPDAFAMKSYVGIVGTGLIFRAVGGWAAKGLRFSLREQPCSLVTWRLG